MELHEKGYSIIRSKEQYFRYCDIHEEISCSGKEGQDIDDELELLYLLISQYDGENDDFPKTEYDPIERLHYLMEINGMDSNELAKILDVDSSFISEILDYKRGLTTEIVIKISKRFKLLPEAFNKPYKVKSGNNNLMEGSYVMNTVKD